MSNRRRKRFLGFNKAQTAVILVLACLLCLVIGICGVLIPSSSKATPTLPEQANALSPTSTLPPADTPTNQSNASPVPIVPDTATPTIQPSPVIQSPTALGTLHVYFFDVGQGDSILILSPTNATVLIDGGDPDTGVVTYLKDLAVHHIELMINTHPHSDHVGGLVQVLQAMPVSHVVTNGQLTTTSVFENFLDAISSAKVPFSVAKQGDILSAGDLSLSVLSPSTIIGDDLNHNSLVLQRNVAMK